MKRRGLSGTSSEHVRLAQGYIETADRELKNLPHGGCAGQLLNLREAERSVARAKAHSLSAQDRATTSQALSLGQQVNTEFAAWARSCMRK